MSAIDHSRSADQFFADWVEPAFRRGDWKAARTHCTTALKRVPNDPVFLAHRAAALEYLYDTAIRHSKLTDENLLGLAENDLVSAWNNFQDVPIWFQLQRCRLYIKLRQYELAASIGKSVLQVWPDCLPARNQMVVAYRALKQWPNMLATLEELIAAEPNNLDHYRSKVLALRESKTASSHEVLMAVDAAIHCATNNRQPADYSFNSSRECTPNLFDLERIRASALLEIGKVCVKAAEVLLLKLVKRQRPSFELWKQLADAYRLQNKSEEEIKALTEAQKHIRPQQQQQQQQQLFQLCQQRIDLLSARMRSTKVLFSPRRNHHHRSPSLAKEFH